MDDNRQDNVIITDINEDRHSSENENIAPTLGGFKNSIWFSLLENLFSPYSICSILSLIFVINSSQFQYLVFPILAIVGLLASTVLKILSLMKKKKSLDFTFIKANSEIVSETLLDSVDLNQNERFEHQKLGKLKVGDVVFANKNCLIRFEAKVLCGKVLVKNKSGNGATCITLQVGDTISKDTKIIGGKAFIKVLSAPSLIIRKKVTKISKLGNVITGIVSLIAIILSIILLILLSSKKVDNLNSVVASNIILLLPYVLFVFINANEFYYRLSLRKYNISVIDSIDDYSQSKSICFDNNVLVEKNYSIKHIISINNEKPEDVLQTITNILDDRCCSPLINSLKSSANYEKTLSPIRYLSKEYDNYFTCEFDGNIFYTLEEPGHTNFINAHKFINKVNELQQSGYYVLILGKANSSSLFEAVAIIVLENSISISKKNYIHELIEKKKNVVIFSESNFSSFSHDISLMQLDPTKLTSLDGKEITLELLNEYSYFSDASLSQKEQILSLLNSAGPVSFVGDEESNNNLYQLADCSIAVSEGAHVAADACINDFVSLPEIENESASSNAKQISLLSLHLSKSLAFSLSLIGLFALSLIFNDPFVSHPISLNFLFVSDVFIFGFASIAILFDKKISRIKTSLTNRLMRILIASSLALFLPLFASYLMFVLHENEVMYTLVQICDGDNPYQVVNTIATLSFLFVELTVIYKSSTMTSKYQKITTYSIIAIAILFVGTSFLLHYLSNNSSLAEFIGLYLNNIVPVNYLECGVIAITTSALYLFICYIVEIFKGEITDVENK